MIRNERARSGLSCARPQIGAGSLKRLHILRSIKQATALTLVLISWIVVMIISWCAAGSG
jgi:hypothetical protein